MERSVFDITLELQSSYSPVSVTVNRGDTHRTLRLHLSDGGRPYPMAENVQAVLTAVKPDGTHLYNTCRVEGNVVCYDLTPQTTAVPGQVECQLRLYGGEGELLTTAAFLLTVADTVYADGDENIQSAGEVTALTKLITQAGEALSQMEAVLKNEVNHAVIDDTKVGSDAWSSKKLADMFCPSFTAQGGAVTCEPLEGYPLEVISTFNVSAPLSGIQLTQCGKNLFDFKQPVSYVTYTSSGGGQGSRYGYSFVLPAGTYTMHAECVGEVKDTYIYCILNDLKGNHLSVDGFGHMKQGTNYWTRTFTLTESAVLYIYDGVSSHTEKVAQALFSEQNNVQIEAGSAATAYEAYHGNRWTVDVADIEGGVYAGSYNWQSGVLQCENGNFQHDPATDAFTFINTNLSTYVPPVVRSIPALGETNVFYSDCGETQVKGRLDIRRLLTERS